jgi:hypothetical protein
MLKWFHALRLYCEPVINASVPVTGFLKLRKTALEVDEGLNAREKSVTAPVFRVIILG